MSYVFDSSFVAAIILPDEKNPKVDTAKAAIGEHDDVFAPHLLWYEMSNIFMNLIRRKRYTYEEVCQFFPLLTAIRLIDDMETGAAYAENLLSLSGSLGLSSYDAAYLELAQRKRATLCTLDEKLKSAAKKCGVVFIPAK